MLNSVETCACLVCLCISHWLCLVLDVFIDSDCLVRQCCGPSRPFAMQILDNNQREVIHLERPLRCSSWCCFCCLQTMEVQSPPGTVIGYVEQVRREKVERGCVRIDNGFYYSLSLSLGLYFYLSLVLIEEC